MDRSPNPLVAGPEPCSVKDRSKLDPTSDDIK